MEASFFIKAKDFKIIILQPSPYLCASYLGAWGNKGLFCLTKMVKPPDTFKKPIQISLSYEDNYLNANLKDIVQILAEATEELLQSKALKTLILFRATIEGIWYIHLFSTHEFMTGFL